MTKKKTNTRGPVAYENWRKRRENALLIETYEVPLYSDAPFFGAIQSAEGQPHELINVGGVREGDGLAHVFTARIASHCDPRDPLALDAETIDASRYHGGGVADELAALLSLLLGSRLRAGETTRTFASGDPYGHPRADRARPTLFMRQAEAGGWRIPRAHQERVVNEVLAVLNTYPDLKPEDANALARAARLYQNGLWIAEADPSTAWLFFVSAIEAVAQREKVVDGKPKDIEEEGLDALWSIVDRCDQQPTKSKAEKYLLRMARSTASYLAFTYKFLPQAPTRPDPLPSAVIDWTAMELRVRLGKIYRHRSNLVHEGTPFPWPMSEPPINAYKFYEEYPISLATSGRGGAWQQSELPMLLHVFEHIVRGCIANWWRSIVPGTPVA